ncbi:MAG TPA: four helix bundle protein [Candidatus Wallbacteria bacterium]|nr:four helix bundle protein [Candidatus Wallbacteria bacterium]
MKKSVTYEKSFNFAVRTIKVYKWLCDTQKEFVMSKQLLRSGTSIGANVKEAINAQSKKDFISKYSIALKEASEAEYWIELLAAGQYFDARESKSLLADINEVISLLTASVKTAKAGLKSAGENDENA